MDNGHVWFSKIGKIRTFMHRSVTGHINTISVKHDSVGDWFITMAVETDTRTDKPADETTQNSQFQPVKPVGIDMGLKSIITTSDGIQIDPPEFLRKSEKKLKRAQKQIARKKKGSGKRSKAETRVQKIHIKIQNLIKNNELITLIVKMGHRENVYLQFTPNGSVVGV